MHPFVQQLARVHFNKVAFYLLCTFFVAAVVLYIYSIVMSVTNVVLRQELVVAVEREEARISELEQQYLARSSELTTALAYEQGFVDVAPQGYVAVDASERLTQASY